MSIYSIVIINKYGGMIFSQEYVKSSMSANDRLRFAATFHGLHAIACSLSPVPGSSGIQEIECDTFRFRCYQSPTGMKFYVVAAPTATNLSGLLQDVYKLYTDFVLKNPFFELNQPIRASKFEVNLDKLIKSKK